MEEKTQEQIEQEEVALRQEIQNEVFEGTAESDPLEPEVEEIVEEIVEPEVEELAPKSEDLQKQIDEQMAQQNEMIKKLEDRLRKTEGRAGALQGELKQAKQAAKQAADAPTAEEIKKALETAKEWEELKEDFPELGKKVDQRFTENEKRIEEAMNALKGSMPDLENIQSSVVGEVIRQMAEEKQKALDGKIARLAEIHPDYKEVRDSEDFGAWLSEQPNHIKAKRHSEDLASVVELLSSFKNREKPAKSKSRLERSVITTKKAPPVRSKTIEDMSEAELRKHVAAQVFKE